MNASDDQMLGRRRVLWERLRDEAHALSFTEILEIPNLDLVTGWTLPMRQGEVAIPEGSGFGWQRDHIDHVLQKVPGGWGQVPANLEETTAPVGVLSFAGGYTYGHWIIDISARLEVLKKRRPLSDMKFAVPGPICEWFLPFLAAYGIEPSQLIPLGEYDKLRASNAFVPSCMRISDYLPAWPHRTALKTLTAYADRLDQGSERDAKILVRHVPQTSSNQRQNLWNIEELETVLTQRGFLVVCPASLSLPDQMAAFRSARVIVGEDSSALHNSVWGTPDAVVVLTAPERDNLLHLSMAELLDYECIYIDGQQRPEGGFSIPIAPLLAAVDRFA